MLFNLIDLMEAPVDYSSSRVRVPLSAGINSAAVLSFLGEHHPEKLKPLELHLYYAHLIEHSPDSLPFKKKFRSKVFMGKWEMCGPMSAEDAVKVWRLFLRLMKANQNLTSLRRRGAATMQSMEGIRPENSCADD